MPANGDLSSLNCTIIVRSAATGDIKYIVEVEINDANWNYRNLFFFGWGKNATFAFRELDKIFPKIKGVTHKQRVALLRLQYGVDLDEEMRDYYQKYVSRNIKEILLMCIREERMDWIKVCEEAGVLRKATVEYAIEQAAAEKKPAFTAFFPRIPEQTFSAQSRKGQHRAAPARPAQGEKEKKPRTRPPGNPSERPGADAFADCDRLTGEPFRRCSRTSSPLPDRNSFHIEYCPACTPTDAMQAGQTVLGKQAIPVVSG